MGSYRTTRQIEPPIRTSVVSPRQLFNSTMHWAFDSATQRLSYHWFTNLNEPQLAVCNPNPKSEFLVGNDLVLEPKVLFVNNAKIAYNDFFDPFSATGRRVHDGSANGILFEPENTGNSTDIAGQNGGKGCTNSFSGRKKAPNLNGYHNWRSALIC